MRVSATNLGENLEKTMETNLKQDIGCGAGKTCFSTMPPTAIPKDLHMQMLKQLLNLKGILFQI